MDPCTLTASVTAAANALASGLSAEEATLLGTLLTQLGDTLITIGTYKDLCCGNAAQ